MESSKQKEVRARDVSKAALEQSSMDLDGLRMGKQRLVSKRKRVSALKKVILEERGHRTDVLPTGLVDAAKEAPIQLSADAPSFMPDFMLGDEPLADEPLVETSHDAPKSLPVGPVKPGLQVEKESEEEVDELSVREAVERLNEMQKDSGRKTPKDPAEAAEKKKQKAEAARADLEVRHYVHQELSEELDEKVKFVLSELNRFQERAKDQPLKFAKLKRYCLGIREASRAITRQQCKGLLVAPNLEISSLEGGLDDTVEDVIELAREHDVPVIFALSRNRIGKALGKNIRMSIVALHSVEGVLQQFKEVIQLTEELRRRWVLMQMARATSESAEAAQKRAEEKAVRDAARKAEKERLAAEKAAEEEKRREAAKILKAKKAEEKAKRVAEQEAEAAIRKAEKEVEQKQLEEERRQQEAVEEEMRLIREQEEEERRKEEAEAAIEAERLRKEMERKEEQERQMRLAQEAAARAAAQKAEEAAEEEDSDGDSSGSDLPLGFNAALF